MRARACSAARHSTCAAKWQRVLSAARVQRVIGHHRRLLGLDSASKEARAMLPSTSLLLAAGDESRIYHLLATHSCRTNNCG